MDKASVLADLRARFGKKILLSPRDIADVISQSVGAQAVARHRGTFGIPLTQRGSRVFVSIYDMADWICGEASAESPKRSRTAQNPEQKPSSSRATNRPSLGRILSFAQREVQFKTELFSALEEIAIAAKAAKPDRKTAAKTI